MQSATAWWGRARRGEAVTFFWQEAVAKLPFLRTLLVLLVSVDLALIAVHILHRTTGLFVRDFFSIEFEDGYGDFYQAMKLGWIALLLWQLARLHRYGHFAVWGTLFGYVMLDDFFAIHETVGYHLANALALAPQWGLRAVDFGEMLVLGTVGLIFLPLLVLTYGATNRADGEIVQRDARTLVALLGVLAVFGVGTDLVHSLLAATPLANAIGTMEDGGEMVVTSVIVWFVLLVLARTTFAPGFGVATPLPRSRDVVD